MRNKKAADVMVKPVVTVQEDALLTDAIKLLLNNRISGLPVVNSQGVLAGCITEHDMMNFAFSGDADSTKVSEAMSAPAFKFTPDTEIPVIVNCFARNRIRRVPIVENDKVVGIVSRRDILTEMLTMYE